MYLGICLYQINGQCAMESRSQMLNLVANQGLRTMILCLQIVAANPPNIIP